jgi:hypothetical protein
MALAPGPIAVLQRFYGSIWVRFTSSCGAFAYGTQ